MTVVKVWAVLLGYSSKSQFFRGGSHDEQKIMTSEDVVPEGSLHDLYWSREEIKFLMVLALFLVKERHPLSGRYHLTNIFFISQILHVFANQDGG